MDFKLTEEERLIRDTAAQFVKRELLSREPHYLRQEQLFLPPGDPPRRELTAKLFSTLAAAAHRAGLWLLELPESKGGSALGALARVLIHREFGRTIVPFAPPSLPALLAESQYADDLAQRKRSLSLAFSQIYTTGSPSDIGLRFRQVPDGYLLAKATMEVYEPEADLFLVPVREEGTHRLALFLVERDLPGLSITDPTDLTTDAQLARLTFTDCKLQNQHPLGYEYEIGAIIAGEQLRIAARCLGIGMRCLVDSIEHARRRVTFGRPLAARQAIQWMLADLSVHLRTCTWLTMEAAWKADQGLPYFEAAALAKRRSAKMAFEAADVAIQIHGGYGVCKEFPFEGFYREARLMRLMFGREAELDRAAGEKFMRIE